MSSMLWGVLMRGQLATANGFEPVESLIEEVELVVDWNKDVKMAL